MNTKEIVSLQFGHYSNFVGAHWWNIQELGFQNTFSDINHNVLYREGQSPQGENTYTPRLLLVDLKGSLKSLPEEGELYQTLPDVPKNEIQWHENLVEINEQPKISKNEYHLDLDNTEKSSVNNKNYDFDKSVEVWSDFLYTRFHPRTVNIINEYEHGASDVSFDLFPLGVNLWKTEQFQEDFNDKIRRYIEECDNFQGFHILTDATDAFSGLSYSCIENLRDEYDRKTILCLPLLPSYYSDYSYTNDLGKGLSDMKDCLRLVNLALCFERLAEYSSLYVPLCTSKIGWRKPSSKIEFYHLNYNHRLQYHTSAILASALDTFSLKYRLELTNYSLSDLCVDLSAYGRKAAAASICLPFSFNAGMDFIDCLNNWEGPLTQIITPNCTIGTNRVMELITLRGIPEDRLKRPSVNAGRQREMAAYKCKTVEEMLSFYLSCKSYGSISNVTTTSRSLDVSVPYPDIFDPYVEVNGNISADRRPEHSGVKSIPVMAGLHSSKEIGQMFESLYTEAQKKKLPRFHQFISAGLEEDEFTECLDKLFALQECYEEKYLI